MRYPAANHGSDKDTSQALPASKHKTLSSPIFLRMCSCEKKWGGCPFCSRFPAILPLHLCKSLGPLRLRVILIPLFLSPSHQRVPASRGSQHFKLSSGVELFSLSVAVHGQKSALLY